MECLLLSLYPRFWQFILNGKERGGTRTRSPILGKQIHYNCLHCETIHHSSKRSSSERTAFHICACFFSFTLVEFLLILCLAIAISEIIVRHNKRLMYKMLRQHGLMNTQNEMIDASDRNFNFECSSLAQQQNGTPIGWKLRSLEMYIMHNALHTHN